MTVKNIIHGHSAKKKKKTALDLWDWIFAGVLLLGLIAGSILIYRLWSRNQQLERLKTKLAELEQKGQEIEQHYQNQKNYQELTANLANSSSIQDFFTDLLTTYAKKFFRSKKIDISQLPLKFEGFYLDKIPVIVMEKWEIVP